MLIRKELLLPHLKRNIKIVISIPRNYDKAKIMYDTLYVLDGQNCFKDHDSSFGTSLHMGKYLSIMAKHNHRICCVALYNAGSDLGRLNEYAPFLVTRRSSKEWEKQNIEVFKAFEKDFFEVIVPFIQNNFPVSLKAKDTFIFGSSLGALCASYFANHHPDVFGGVGLFSNCPFLCEEAYFKDLDKHHNKKCRTFIYVGMKENSDGIFDEFAYFNASKRMYDSFISYKTPTKLVISEYGHHHESIWEKHLLEFLSFMYSDDISISY